MPKVRDNFPVRRKYKVLTWMQENNATAVATAREFGIRYSMVLRWAESEEILRDLVKQPRFKNFLRTYKNI